MASTFLNNSLFPTHVGVSLSPLFANSPYASLPHTRGGVPKGSEKHGNSSNSSPHTWGCPYEYKLPELAGDLFPTHVGVSPRAFFIACPLTSLPHTRGGVPKYFIFLGLVAYSSPHTWGCPYKEPSREVSILLFPTHVGVSPPMMFKVVIDISLPHTRGGVPHYASNSLKIHDSSPHTWGCPSKSASLPMTRKLFPTHVGVSLHI